MKGLLGRTMVMVMTTINVLLLLVLSVVVEADHDDHVQYFTPHSVHSQILSSFAYNSSEDIFKFRYISPTKIIKGGRNFLRNVGENIGLHSKQNKVGSSSTSSSLEIPSAKRGPKLDDGEEKSKMSNDSDHVNVTFGSHSVKGRTKHVMEDYVIAETRNFAHQHHEVGLFAIFDGYLSYEIPEYLQSHLFDNIILKSAFWVNTTRAVRKGYLLTNTRILENTKTGVVFGGLGGSAAVTAILLTNRKGGAGGQSNYKLVVANVGDSRAVICCKNGHLAEQLSVDHVSTNEMESRGTKKRGVKVREGDQGHGVPNVKGHFPLSRAFGGMQYSHYISCEPNVVVEMIAGQTEFLVLASRPLWNVMSNQQAVDSIRKINNAQQAAKHLIHQALSMPSYRRQDDISCVVVRFR